MPLHLIEKDITTMKVDAIVNSTNHHMIGWSGVDKLIHEKGGPEFEKECEALDNTNVPGGVVCTNAYNMDCHYIIHTQAPTWHGGIHGEEAILTSCYKKSLMKASEMGCKSVAFPLLSAGNRMYPISEALDIAVRTIDEYLDFYDDMDVYLVLHDAIVEEIAKEKFGDLDEFLKKEYKPGMSLDEAKAKADVDAILKLHHKDFPETLNYYMNEKGFQKSSVLWNKAGVSKQVFSNILSGKAKPSLKTAVALAMAMELNWGETVDFLASAGLALSNHSKFDIIVKYFIKNGCYDIAKFNMQMQNFNVGIYLGAEA